MHPFLIIGVDYLTIFGKTEMNIGTAGFFKFQLVIGTAVLCLNPVCIVDTITGIMRFYGCCNHFLAGR